MISGIVDCPGTPKVGLCSSLSGSELASEEDVLFSSQEDESSDSEFSLEEADEDKALFA